METFLPPKAFVINPHYREQREKSLSHLTDDMIDANIISLINGFNRLPYCFTLQSCYGHFVTKDQKDLYNLEPLPAKDIVDRVTYRLSYIAFCFEHSTSGIGLFEALKRMTSIDPDYIQFCCAAWFWENQVNSYALQVIPDRFKRNDTATVDFKEAQHIEKIRNELFMRLYDLMGDFQET